jgi:hypothetical protein
MTRRFSEMTGLKVDDLWSPQISHVRLMSAQQKGGGNQYALETSRWEDFFLGRERFLGRRGGGVVSERWDEIERGEVGVGYGFDGGVLWVVFYH